MRFWQRVKRALNLSVTDEKAWNPSLWRLNAAQQSGESVDEYTALTYSAVYNAITLIAGTISSIPLHLMQRGGDGKRQATEHYLYDVLHTQANPYMTAMALRECLLSHVLAWGNGYAEKVRDGSGRIKELWPITPNRVSPKMEDGRLAYEITIDGDRQVFYRDKILHIPGLGFDGFVGYSVVGMAAKSIGLGMAMETFGSNFFGNGTHPSAIVTHPNRLGEEAHKNLKDSLAASYSGLGQSHKMLLLEEGMKIEKLGIPPNDSQFLESRQFGITEIARWFNLPPHKLKDLTKSSFNNIESEQTSFVMDSLLPWGVRLEQNYNMQLLLKRQRAAGFYFKHIFEGLLRGSHKDRSEFYGNMLDRGVFSINDVRELEDMNPVEGGDKRLVPLNMTTLEKAGEDKEPDVSDNNVTPITDMIKIKNK